MACTRIGRLSAWVGACSPCLPWATWLYESRFLTEKQPSFRPVRCVADYTSVLRIFAIDIWDNVAGRCLVDSDKHPWKLWGRQKSTFLKTKHITAAGRAYRLSGMPAHRISESVTFHVCQHSKAFGYERVEQPHYAHRKWSVSDTNHMEKRRWNQGYPMNVLPETHAHVFLSLLAPQKSDDVKKTGAVTLWCLCKICAYQTKKWRLVTYLQACWQELPGFKNTALPLSLFFRPPLKPTQGFFKCWQRKISTVKAWPVGEKTNLSWMSVSMSSMKMPFPSIPPAQKTPGCFSFKKLSEYFSTSLVCALFYIFR